MSSSRAGLGVHCSYSADSGTSQIASPHYARFADRGEAGAFGESGNSLLIPAYQSREFFSEFETKDIDSVIDVSVTEQYRNPMSSSNRNLEAQLKELPRKVRARLALTLIASLDPGTDEDAEALWLNDPGTGVIAHNQLRYC